LRHHEWWDGSGYPIGLAGEAIPVECRILSIVDAFDAMTSDRPYRKAMPTEQAVQELRKFGGIQFDPDLVAIFLRGAATAGIVDRRSKSRFNKGK
jgi:HD-GYP domain-containing protein (c-di-GMP phosphodiesterase class II)